MIASARSAYTASASTTDVASVEIDDDIEGDDDAVLEEGGARAAHIAEAAGVGLLATALGR
jgi:hypothetical protein|tara:strand:+ start:598 stop:780 length:183 start_codon:yes stop_codon:yes gene_type:complete